MVSITQNPQFDIQTLTSIDDVINVLEEIIAVSEKNNDPLGYFAVLYQKVTKKVKEGVQSGFFADGARMEQLDVVFAKRYIDAYYSYGKGLPATASWQKAFTFATHYWPTVLQHLLMGINAHINLDLGIVAAEISRNRDLKALEGDFNKINDILFSLVEEVQENLCYINPFLRKILRISGKLDNLLVDFSMKTARDGAWKFALSLFGRSPEELDQLIAVRDEKIARIGDLITPPGTFTKILLGIMRLGERGPVSRRITYLRMGK